MAGDLGLAPLGLALASTLCFSLSSLVFAEVSVRTSVIWMNTVKALVAFAAFSLTVVWSTSGLTHALDGFLTLPSLGFVVSGALGLFLGDIFLLMAFTRIGASRSLLIFGFQPILLGIAGYLLFAQPFGWLRAVAVLALMGCLFSISYERFRANGSWEVRGLVLALLGMALDTTGVLITRAAFEASPGLSPFEANFLRLVGALSGFFLLSFHTPIGLRNHFLRLTPKWRTLALSASLTGTFLSLSLYLTAVKSGHLASISAIALTGPLFAGFAECVLNRRRPSRWYLFASLLFLCGSGLLLWVNSGMPLASGERP